MQKVVDLNKLSIHIVSILATVIFMTLLFTIVYNSAINSAEIETRIQVLELKSLELNSDIQEKYQELAKCHGALIAQGMLCKVWGVLDEK